MERSARASLVVPSALLQLHSLGLFCTVMNGYLRWLGLICDLSTIYLRSVGLLKCVRHAGRYVILPIRNVAMRFACPNERR